MAGLDGIQKNPDVYIGGSSSAKKSLAPAPKTSLAKPKPFVPFGGEPKNQRPTKKQSRDEINGIRKSENDPDDFELDPDAPGRRMI